MSDHSIVEFSNQKVLFILILKFIVSIATARLHIKNVLELKFMFTDNVCFCNEACI